MSRQMQRTPTATVGTSHAGFHTSTAADMRVYGEAVWQHPSITMQQGLAPFTVRPPTLKLVVIVSYTSFA